MVHTNVEDAIAQMRRGVAELEPEAMLSETVLGEDDERAIASELRVNTTLTTLDLSRNAIGAAGAASLAEALRVNTALTELYLSHNSIGDVGAASLADALRVNSSLTKLILYINSIGDAGAASLAAALRSNTTLTNLYLRTNSIGDAGAASLADALRVNTSLTNLFMVNNAISPANESALSDLASANKATTSHFESATPSALAAILRADFAPPVYVPSITTPVQTQHAFIVRLAAILRSDSQSEEEGAVALAREALAGPLRGHPAAHVLHQLLCSDEPTVAGSVNEYPPVRH
jgi:hypothetical protein